MSRLGSPPRSIKPPAEAEALRAAEVLERVRDELRELAVVDVMTDGSRKVSAAAEILEAVIGGLRADGDSELLELRKRASSKPPLERRERSDEVFFLFELLKMSVEREQHLLGARRYDEAAAKVMTQIVDAVIGAADIFENLRRCLPPVQDLEHLRPKVAQILSGRLEEDDRDDLWCEGTLRAVFRTWGVTLKDAEGMTDFIRKRIKKQAGMGAPERAEVELAPAAGGEAAPPTTGST